MNHDISYNSSSGMGKSDDLTKEECAERTKARSMSRRGGSESDADSDIPISLGMAEHIFRSSPERARHKVNFDVNSGMTTVSEESVPKDVERPLRTSTSASLTGDAGRQRPQQHLQQQHLQQQQQQQQQQQNDTIRSGANLCTSFHVERNTTSDQQQARSKEFAKKRSRSLCAPNPKFEFGPKASIMKSCLGMTTVQDPSTLRLNWDASPDRVLVIKKQFDDSIVPHFKQLLHFLVAEKRLTVFVEESVVKENLGQDPSFEAIKDQISVFSTAVDLANKIDFIICMGGDGTLLHASSIFQNSVPPIISFHLGSLGFLMPFDFSTFRTDVERTMAGDVPLVLRSRLKGFIIKRQQDSQLNGSGRESASPERRPQKQQPHSLPNQRQHSTTGQEAGEYPAGKSALEDENDDEISNENGILAGRHVLSSSIDESLSTASVTSFSSGTPILVLNEIVIDRGLSAFISNVDLYLNGRLITRVQGDGLIISTPTGSTAYALAAGSSMVHPSVQSILITPICPHSLSFRPISVPAGVELKVMLSPEARNSAWVSFDGRNRQELSHGDVLRVTTSVHPVPSIAKNDQLHDWFESLADCLHWNVRQPQKSFGSNRPTIPNSNSTSSLESINNSQS